MHYDCLIVDDEIELAKMTAEYFEMFDVKTQYVESAASCFAFLEQNDVDLILLKGWRQVLPPRHPRPFPRWRQAGRRFLQCPRFP